MTIMAEKTNDTGENLDLRVVTPEERKAEKERWRKMKYDLNQSIMEEQYDPKLSISQNIISILDAARRNPKYQSEEFDRYGVSKMKNLRQYDLSNHPKGYDVRKNILLSDKSPEDVLNQYGFHEYDKFWDEDKDLKYFLQDADKEGLDYDVKQHLLDFLKSKKEGYQSSGLIMNYGDYGRSYL